MDADTTSVGLMVSVDMVTAGTAGGEHGSSVGSRWRYGRYDCD